MRRAERTPYLYSSREFTERLQLIELQSGTPDYVSVTIYHTEDRYSGEVADFSFDFMTKELYIEYAESKVVSEAIIKAFRGIYRSINVITEDNES